MHNTMNSNKSGMAFHNTECNGEAKTSPVAIGFCRKKWLKNSLDTVFSNAETIITNIHQMVFSYLGFQIPIEGIFINSNIIDPNGYYSTIGHGITRVDDDIQKYLF